MALLQIENLNFTYPDADQRALNSISLSVDEGEFIVICGETGCGKTTLIRLLKPELAPVGEKDGLILYGGVSLDELTEHRSATEIGYVMQNPDQQIVTDKVWHELAFGLENLGESSSVIRCRVGEMASYFGIQDWFRKPTDELSGGQKQLLNLASVMVMQPKVLILDEPTSQLDPIAASDFITTLRRLNREFGLTVLLVEHRLEEVFPSADRVLLMEKGGILFFDKPEHVGLRMASMKEHPMLKGLPSAVRIFNALDIDDACPLTVKEGRSFLSRHFSGVAFESNSSASRGEESLHSACRHDRLSENTEVGISSCGSQNMEAENQPVSFHSIAETMIELKDIWFRYGRDLPDILRGVRLRVNKGEIYCLLGGNGTGKTTLLQVTAGLSRAYRGHIRIAGKPIGKYRNGELYRHMLAVLPQNPQTVFIKDTVEEDFTEILEAMEAPNESGKSAIERAAGKLGVLDLLGKHPYDLSGGEMQKCALAKMLLLEPRVLLLDEPTKGLDAGAREQLGKILEDLRSEGMTFFIVTHDVEFAAEYADRCAMYFDGEILTENTPRLFFSGNNFYTTAANRMARHLYSDAVTCRDVVRRCRIERARHGENGTN